MYVPSPSQQKFRFLLLNFLPSYQYTWYVHMSFTPEVCYLFILWHPIHNEFSWMEGEHNFVSLRFLFDRSETRKIFRMHSSCESLFFGCIYRINARFMDIMTHVRFTFVFFHVLWWYLVDLFHLFTSKIWKLRYMDYHSRLIVSDDFGFITCLIKSVKNLKPRCQFIFYFNASYNSLTIFFA